MSVVIAAGEEPVPGYRLLRPLGRGGFGEVWEAEGPGGALKAVKVLHGNLDNVDEKTRGRVAQELKSLKRIQAIRHPYLLSLERYDIVDGRLIIVTELAEGSLWDRFQECRGQGLPGIPREELLAYMEEAAEALDLMNQRHRLQHLDIKPHNLLLCFHHIKVADFGLVKYLEETNVTRTGGFTPAYGAPEMFQGVVSHYCDQYSLALVYQEMLTGERAFSGTKPAELMRQHLSAPPNLAPLPPDDRDAVKRALAKNARDRFPSCTDLVKSLRAAPGAAAPSAARKPRAADESSVTWQEVSAGDGLLSPTLVIGLGGQGLRALHALRGMIRDRFGTLRSVPHVRLLLLDTDPAVSGKADEGEVDRLLGAERTLPVPLRRPPHYFQARADRPPLNWFDSRLIYQVPREPRNPGWRPLGRLALVDHYATVVQRLRHEIKACASREALDAAQKKTGLGLRSNQPRVYVVTHLAGGSGSGMFLDLAYLVRRELRGLGFRHGEVVGLFLLPPAEDQGPDALRSLANATAALIELHHFSAAGTTFAAEYRADALLQDQAAPFERWCVFAAPPGEKPAEEAPPPAQAADLVFAELTTALARRGLDAPASATRLATTVNTVAGLPGSAPGRPPAGAACGIDRFSWPLRKVVKQTARRLAADLFRAWTAPAAYTLGAEVRAWLATQWAEAGLGSDQMFARLHEDCTRVLGPDPLATARTWAEAVLLRGGPQARPPAAEVVGLLGHIESLFGPLFEISGGLGAPDSPVKKALDQAAAERSEEWRDQWRQRVWSLLDRPGFRFAAAEEAARHSEAMVNQAAKDCRGQEQLHAGRAEQALANFQLLAGDTRRPVGGAELLPALMAHVEHRYRAKVFGYLARMFHGFRDAVIDCRHEVEHYRGELAKLDHGEADRGGDPFLAAEVDSFLAGLTARDREALEQDVQALIHKQHDSLADLCFQNSWANRFRHLADGVRRAAEVFVQDRVGFPDVIEKFRARHPDDAAARQALAAAFARAEAALGPAAGEPAWFVALPASPLRDALAAQVAAARPDLAPALVASMNDILVYAERPTTAAETLDALGRYARRAYEAALLQPTSPHARADVSWLPVAQESSGSATAQTVAPEPVDHSLTDSSDFE